VVRDGEHLLGVFREIADMAGELNDQGTLAFMSDFISQQKSNYGC
jgi:hypothetical protein